MKRIAINGLGRIGRLILRHYMDLSDGQVEIVAANDLVPTDDLAYLIRYDSAHGRAPFVVEAAPESLKLNGREIMISAIKDPAQLPWKDLGVDVVYECTGLFTARDAAAAHLAAGARRVVIGAPSKDADMTVIVGVNERVFDPARHQIISNASCTTNSLVPPMKVLLDHFGVEMAMVTTVHAYTATQGTVDRPAKKKIRGRAAAVNLIPTSTGSDIATVQVLPELEGRLRALAIRAPVIDGAITDITALLKKPATAESLNSTFREAAAGPLAGILGYSEDDLVSSDIIGDLHSSILHAQSTRVVGERMVKLQCWYDNEAAYARRMLDLALRLPL
ncbi:type I glyceraldehyde-3-phosphate dehydrogenase [Acidihalobacter aeolianus]|uniref:Type I glyceraldehyde-3-phosphate dehydrogenase n=1 Tax=Acidihalobacter aeolianus TaxID=2792603 RepID=A0A1D8KC05_9GAMM|nr:type I glyceraldehyde-3-phosphate dehydrogenase [Acidihalobacter aeolianus]AOV18498.1 type I glyceraldehyde-3-phosphate dehydrogenase [Acidihalobacter aeolianus]